MLPPTVSTETLHNLYYESTEDRAQRAVQLITNQRRGNSFMLMRAAACCGVWYETSVAC